MFSKTFVFSKNEQQPTPQLLYFQLFFCIFLYIQLLYFQRMSSHPPPSQLSLHASVRIYLFSFCISLFISLYFSSLYPDFVCSSLKVLYFDRISSSGPLAELASANWGFLISSFFGFPFPHFIFSGAPKLWAY